MRRSTRILACAAAVAAVVVSTTTPPADGADTTLRFVVLTPNADADVAYGVSLAVAASNDAKAAGAKRPAVEALSVNAGDSSIAALAVEKAAKDKCAGVVVVAADAVAPVLETVARKAKLPLIFVGSGGSTRTLDPADPVFRVDVPAADAGLALAEWLRLKSGKASIGLPAQTKSAWLIVENTTWAKATAAALRADDVDGLVAPGEFAMSADFTMARNLPPPPPTCDRAIFVGGADAFLWIAPSFEQLPAICIDATLRETLIARRPHTAFVAATPAWADERHVDEIAAKHPPAGGKSAQLAPSAVRAYVAAAALIEAALHVEKRGVVGALRDVREGSGAKEWPLFDATGCVDHWRWSIWATSADGGVAPIKSSFLPDANLGPFLGGKPGARYRALAGGTCVRVGFGGDAATPKTIDADLATIGLVPEAGPAFKMACEQNLARTCGKLSRVWSKHYDGSARPMLSWKIAFVPEGTDTAGASAVWDAVIAGDGGDGTHGGQNFPKDHRAQALSTYLLRNAKLLHDAKLDPPLCAADAVYLDGSYAWNASAEGNQRSDKIRALLDGAASTFCMKLCKELGHLAGLSIDGSGEPRSIMVTKGGEGVSDEFAYFPPAFAKVLEKTLGRVGAEGR